MLVPYVLLFASQTLLFLCQSLYSSPAVLSLQANQPLSFAKSCPTCLHFLLIYSHLPMPCSSTSLSCSNSSGSLSFQPQFFKHNYSSITFSNLFVQKAPAPIPLMKYSFPWCHSHCCHYHSPSWFELPYSSSPLAYKCSTWCQCSQSPPASFSKHFTLPVYSSSSRTHSEFQLPAMVSLPANKKSPYLIPFVHFICIALEIGAFFFSTAQMWNEIIKTYPCSQFSCPIWARRASSLKRTSREQATTASYWSLIIHWDGIYERLTSWKCRMWFSLKERESAKISSKWYISVCFQTIENIKSFTRE